MKDSAGVTKPVFASIRLGDEVGKIERLSVSKGGQEQIRFSIWSQEKMMRRPLSLTEKELIDLLQAAIQEGILSRDFVGELHSVIEI